MKKTSKIIMIALWALFGIAFVLTAAYNLAAGNETCYYAWILPAIALVPALSFTVTSKLFVSKKVSANVNA